MVLKRSHHNLTNAEKETLMESWTWVLALLKNISRFFEKSKNTSTKYPLICDMESVKVYKNPWMLAELAKTFTIDVTFYDLEKSTRLPTSISLGPRNRGICVKWPLFSKYPDFSAPEKSRWGASVRIKDHQKLRRLWKSQTIRPAYTGFYRLLRIPYHKSGGIL